MGSQRRPLASTSDQSVPAVWTVISFDLGSGCALTAGTTYALQVQTSQAGVHTCIDAQDGYTRGWYITGNDGQDNCDWNVNDGKWDIWFEEYGVPVNNGSLSGGGWAGPKSYHQYYRAYLLQQPAGGFRRICPE